MFSEMAVLMPLQEKRCVSDTGGYSETEAIKIIENQYQIKIMKAKWYKQFYVDHWVVLTIFAEYTKKL